ncbi:Homeobox protein Hox-B8a, partial [Xenoophorus captivus]
MDLTGSRPTVVYGPGSSATFQHTPQIQDFYHHSASSLPSNPYQQSPCAVTCHGEPGNFYGYDALQRQTLFGAQDADLVQYSDCKLGGATGLGTEDTEGTEQSPSPTQLFPWMRPQGEETETPLQRLSLYLRLSLFLSKYVSPDEVFIFHDVESGIQDKLRLEVNNYICQLMGNCVK